MGFGSEGVALSERKIEESIACGTSSNALYCSMCAAHARVWRHLEWCWKYVDGRGGQDA
jgi:hypothetical protein